MPLPCREIQTRDRPGRGAGWQGVPRTVSERSDGVRPSARGPPDGRPERGHASVEARTCRTRSATACGRPWCHAWAPPRTSTYEPLGARSATLPRPRSRNDRVVCAPHDQHGHRHPCDALFHGVVERGGEVAKDVSPTGEEAVGQCRPDQARPLDRRGRDPQPRDRGCGQREHTSGDPAARGRGDDVLLPSPAPCPGRPRGGRGHRPAGDRTQLLASAPSDIPGVRPRPPSAPPWRCPPGWPGGAPACAAGRPPRRPAPATSDR